MKYTLTLMFLALCLCTSAKTYYVNQNAFGANDGSSWSNAFAGLQSALSIVASGDSIKVAAGTYIPSNIQFSPSTFIIGRGIVLLGGYPATGNPSDAQRDWVNQPTILSNTGYSGVLASLTNIDTATILDGFQVTAGYPGLVITNCSGIIIRNMLFQKNAEWAVSIDSSQTVFTNCVFDQNQSFTADVDLSASSNSAFYNCIFSGVQQYNSSAISSQNSSTSLTNCTIVNYRSVGFQAAGTGVAIIKNCIFWNNTINSSADGADLQTGSQTLIISNCLTETFYQAESSTILVNENPRFFNPAHPAGADNKWFTSDDGLQLTIPCSPALNAGNNSADAGLSTDILGNPRIYNGGTVDLGAYEEQATPGTPVRTVFVNSTASGAGNGDSWQDAFPTLQQALLYCADTIKVAAGTYTTANSFQDSVFSIETGKVLLGGYPAGGSPTDADRNPARYPTILSGKYTATNSAQASPVLEAFHCDSTTVIDGFNFSNSNFIGYQGGSTPGLHIGYGSNPRVANCRFQYVSNGNASGGGILISDSSQPVITRTLIEAAVTTSASPAVQCIGGSSPTFINCQLNGAINTNSSSLAGGCLGIGFDHSEGRMDSCQLTASVGNADRMVYSTASTIQMNSCTFHSRNSSGNLIVYTNGSGGVFNNCVFQNVSASTYSVYLDNSSPVFTKCLFDSTTTSVMNVHYSAPVFNNCVSLDGRFMQNQKSFPQLSGCTVINTYSDVNALNQTALIINEDSSTLSAINTIFWGSKLTGGWKDIADTTTVGNPYIPQAQPSRSVLSNCLSRNYGTNGVNGNLVGVDPRFYQLSDIPGPDGVIFTADDGIRLAQCSPAVNTGNDGLGSIQPTDILGNPRIYGGIVDMGAYELQRSPVHSGSYYVNAAATGNADGSSWADAYTSLQTAVCNVCTDTIRVAAGTYTPALTARDSSFAITTDITLLGGYASTGAPSDAQRSPFMYPTILSGNVGNPADSTDNSETIMTAIGVPDSATIDGFVFQSGYSYGAGIALNAAGGSAFASYNSKTILTNCQFLRNYCGLYGGAIGFGGLDSCYINRSIFSNNTAGDYGGAIASTGAYLQLTNCVFDSNHAYGQGGALQLQGTFNMQGCLFYGNYTTDSAAIGAGGAVDASMAAGNIVNCTFVGNTSADTYLPGGGALNAGGYYAGKVWNCIFSGNIQGHSMTAQGADINFQYGNIVYNCLTQVNYGLAENSSQQVTNPGFTDLRYPAGKDGKWLTADDGLQLLYNSPGINFGNNSAVTGLSTDLAGNPRIVGGTVDAGAYEYQNQPFADAGNDTTVCAAASFQIGLGGDPAFSYQWTSLPAGFSANTAIATIRPTGPATYYLTATNGTTTSMDSVHVGAVDSIPPSISIYTDTTGICVGATAAFNAQTAFGGDSAVIQWMANGVNVGTNSPQFSSATLPDSSIVSAQLTSSIACAVPKTVTSNQLTMTVSPYVTPSVTLTGPIGAVCVNAAELFKAYPVNGGNNPGFEWEGPDYGYPYVSSVDSVLINLPDTLSRVSVVMTSSNACVTTKQAAAVIYVHTSLQLAPAVTISASATQVCADSSILFTATPTNGGNAPGYQWLINSADAGTDSNIYRASGLLNGDQVSVRLTSNASCAYPATMTSNSIPIIVSPLVTPAITITKSAAPPGQPLLATAQIEFGGSSPGYQWQDSTASGGWQDIPGALADSLSYSPGITASAIRCLLRSSLECVSSPTVASSPLVFTPTSPTSTDSSNNIRLYPNPVTSTLTVDSLQTSEVSVEIMGVTGMVLMKVATGGQTRIVIDLSTLPRGIYIVCIVRNNGANIYRQILKW